MARKINAIPKGYRTATPMLVVRNAAAAIEFYSNVFGAVELSRLHDSDGVLILRAELKIGNSIIHLCDEMPALGFMSPIYLGGSSGVIQLYFDDLNSVWDRALAAQATVVLPLEDTYWGERTGRIVDPFGHVWTLSKCVEALSKTEITKRAAAIYAPEIAQVSILTTKDDIQTVDISTVDISNVEMADKNTLEAATE